ncbi:MAG: TonB-dependent receptor [Steroidobacteraceae bacterium]
MTYHLDSIKPAIALVTSGLMSRTCTAALAGQLLLSTVGFQTAVAAETDGTSAANTLEEIVVTAQFRNQNVQDTPLAITAVNAAMIQDRGFQNVADLTGAAPNVNFAPAAGFQQGAFLYIRGIGQADSGPVFEPGVGIYIDDVYFGSIAGSNFNLLDLQRVEILRGPQGTLAGANSIGGSVKLFTVKPHDGGSDYLEAGYGSNRTYLLRGATDLTLVKDQLFLRVAGGFKSDKGYIDLVDFTCANPSPTVSGTLPRSSNNVGNCKTGDAGGSTAKSLRTALRWLPSDDLEVNLSADTDSSSVNAAPQILHAFNQANVDPIFQAQQQTNYGVQFDGRFLPPSGKYISYATYTNGAGQAVNPESKTDNYGFTGTVDYKFSDTLNLKSITSWRKSQSTGVQDADQSLLGADLGVYNYDSKQFTQELRLNGSAWNNLVDWTVGGFYYHNKTDLTGHVNNYSALTFFGGLNFLVDDTVSSDKTAGFVNVTLHPTERLNVTGGYRYTSSTKDYAFGRVDPTPPSIVTIFGLDQLGAAPTQKTKKSDVRLAVDYRWTRNFMTYAQFATGFKDGGINPTPLTPSQAVPFDAETLKSYEVGFKSDFFDRRMRFNVAGFISKYKDLQLQAVGKDLSGLTATLTVNTGQATIKGVEAELEVRPVDRLLLTASGSYIDFKYDDLGAAAGVNAGPCITCTNIYTPKNTAYLSAQYDFNLGAAGTLTPRISDEYRGGVQTELNNDPRVAIPSYWLANARLTWKPSDSEWEASLAVSNLFDKFYYTYVHSTINQNGFAQATPGRPRELMLTIRKMF